MEAKYSGSSCLILLGLLAPLAIEITNSRELVKVVVDFYLGLHVGPLIASSILRAP